MNFRIRRKSMKNRTKSLSALLLAGMMLVGVIGCSKDDTADPTSAYDTPEKYITLPELSSVTLSQSEIDQTLDQQIEQIRTKCSREDYQTIAEAAKKGDRVNISFTAKPADPSVTLSDIAQMGLTADKINYTLGDDSFVSAYYDDEENMLTDSFDNQLIGLKADEVKEVTVTFPDDYFISDEVRGMEIILTVTVHSVSRVTVDEKDKLVIGYRFEQPEGDANTAEDFGKLFVNSRCTFDPTAENADSVMFATLFKMADHADSFIGLNKYDQVEAKVTVPSDADEKYAAYSGKEIGVTFTIYTITTVPEWNDAFVKEYTGDTYSTAAAFEAAMVDDITADKAYAAIADASEVSEYPEAETDLLYKQYVAELIGQQSGKEVDGLSDEELMALVERSLYEQLCATALINAKQDVQSRLIQASLIKQLGITLSDDEYKKALESGYQEYLDKYAEYYENSYGIRFESAADMEKQYGKETLERQFELDKVMKLLPDLVTVNE